MAKTRNAWPGGFPEALEQMQEMLDGARSELGLGRPKAAGTLAMAGAVRAADLICDAEVGRHSTAPSHTAALDLLATVPDAEASVEDLSVCLSRKSDYNYHLADIDPADALIVLEAAERLGAEARRRLAAEGGLRE